MYEYLSGGEEEGEKEVSAAGGRPYSERGSNTEQVKARVHPGLFLSCTSTTIFTTAPKKKAYSSNALKTRRNDQTRSYSVGSFHISGYCRVRNLKPFLKFLVVNFLEIGYFSFSTGNTGPDERG